MTYRAKLVETSSFSNSDLIDFISQWVSEDGVIRVQFVLIRVDRSCQVAISSFADTECTSQSTEGGGDIAVIGGVVGCIVVVLIIAIAVVVIAALVLNSRRAKLKLQREPK